MIAVDTNIVLRLILGDDQAQLDLIRAMMTGNTLFVSLTVLLEVGWVLESRYRLSREATADALGDITLLDGVITARAEAVVWALGRYRAGADLADMIHLASATKLASFATLDRRLARQAGDGTPIAVETLA